MGLTMQCQDWPYHLPSSLPLSPTYILTCVKGRLGKGKNCHIADHHLERKVCGIFFSSPQRQEDALCIQPSKEAPKGPLTWLEVSARKREKHFNPFFRLSCCIYSPFLLCWEERNRQFRENQQSEASLHAYCLVGQLDTGGGSQA